MIDFNKMKQKKCPPPPIKKACPCTIILPTSLKKEGWGEGLNNANSEFITLLEAFLSH